ncbi:MAG: hypothetical protein Q9183_003262 [Haloplaca sp. 2 TL-2023]
MDSPQEHATVRSRASTLQNGAELEDTSSRVFNQPEQSSPKTSNGDIYDKDSVGALDVLDGNGDGDERTQQVPEGFDDLPIELVSLIDRFIESLTAKVYPEPPTIDRLSDMFQDFYTKADSHIATHISALSTKYQRGSSPSASISSKGSGNRLRSMSSKDTIESPILTTEQQMLTPQEISDRRKTRRVLEQKRLALEEAVERRTCEKVYKRIWRHSSTLDEVRDEKLRSRTAALALVGIGLKDLGIEVDAPPMGEGGTEQSVESRIEDWIAPARDGLLRMNEARYPLGKLQHLAAAHKCIVDVLSRLHQSSSSADEILPTLIYTLITSPTEGINVISNLNFTQRFRSANKIDGEAAYCLTNLEAAITFLETVDLASLRSDEPLEGPPKASSRPSTPRSEGGGDGAAGPRFPSSKSASVTAEAKESPPKPLFSDPLQSPPAEDESPSSPPHQRRRSNLFQPTTSAFGAASDAVRTTADQGLKNIGSTLDNSFKFLFGRLKEQQVRGEGGESNGTVLLPKTLDDARKLVDPKPAEDDHGNISGSSSIAEEHPEDPALETDSTGSTLDDKLLGIFAGRKAQPRDRDRSVDSLQSAGSGGKKVAFTKDQDKTKMRADSTGPLSSSPLASNEQSASAPNSAVESMRSLGNSLNPLNRLTGMSMMKGFGRSSSGQTPTLSSTAEKPEKPSAEPPELLDSNGAMSRPSVPTKIAPPIQRFVDASDAAELRIADVAELLRDYQRLAAHLKGDGKV